MIFLRSVRCFIVRAMCRTVPKWLGSPWLLSWCRLFILSAVFQGTGDIVEYHVFCKCAGSSYTHICWWSQCGVLFQEMSSHQCTQQQPVHTALTASQLYITEQIHNDKSSWKSPVLSYCPTCSASSWVFPFPLHIFLGGAFCTLSWLMLVQFLISM